MKTSETMVRIEISVWARYDYQVIDGKVHLEDIRITVPDDIDHEYVMDNFEQNVLDAIEEDLNEIG